MSVSTTYLDRDSQRSALERDLMAQLSFQSRWRLISMIGYVTTTVGMLITSASATMFAAKGVSDMAAIFSAVATVLIGIEKSLLFREKWKFHLLMFTKLNVLRANLHFGRLNTDQASREYASAMSLYASELPMAPRERD